MDGSPLGDRGRRATKKRARTKTATQRDQDGLLFVDLGDGDVDGEGEEGLEEEDEEEQEQEFSDILADAILKRPESIRDGSFRSARKDSSRGKLSTNSSGDVVGRLRKGDVSLDENEGGSGDGGERDVEEDGDGWIREPPPVSDSRPVISGADNDGS